MLLTRLFVGFLIFTAIVSENPVNSINLAYFSSDACALTAALNPNIGGRANTAGKAAFSQNTLNHDSPVYKPLITEIGYFVLQPAEADEAHAFLYNITEKPSGLERVLIRVASDNSPPECA